VSWSEVRASASPARPLYESIKNTFKLSHDSKSRREIRQTKLNYSPVPDMAGFMERSRLLEAETTGERLGEGMGEPVAGVSSAAILDFISVFKSSIAAKVGSAMIPISTYNRLKDS